MHSLFSCLIPVTSHILTHLEIWKERGSSSEEWVASFLVYGRSSTGLALTDKILSGFGPKIVPQHGITFKTICFLSPEMETYTFSEMFRVKTRSRYWSLSLWGPKIIGSSTGSRVLPSGWQVTLFSWTSRTPLPRLCDRFYLLIRDNHGRRRKAEECHLGGYIK